MKHRKSWLAMMAASLLAVTGCLADTSAGQYRKELTLPGQPASPELLPANVASEWDAYLISNLYTGLTRFTGDTGRPSRAVAQSIDTEDRATWTVTLRRGWTFHDGSPVTADSFINAWNYAADGANGMSQQSAFSNIAGFAEVAGPEPSPAGMSGLVKVDDRTFTVTLTVRDSQFETLLATAPFAPLPESFFTEGTQLVGNGPFIAEEVSAERVVLTRNEDLRAGKARLTKVRFVPVSDDGAAVTAVAEGKVAAAAVATESVPQELLDRQPSLRTSTSAGTTLEYLVFPMWDPRFARPQIRAAISAAIDRDQILGLNPQWERTKATSWAAPTANGYSAAGCGNACVYNVDRARTNFAEGGGFGEPLYLSYPSGSAAGAFIEQICVSVRNTLEIECAGNELPLEAFNAAVADRQIPGPFFSTQALPEVPNLPASVTPLYGTGAALNSGAYSNPEFDGLTAAGLAADPGDATRLLQDAQRSLGADLPSIPLWYPNRTVVSGAAVKDVFVTPWGFVDIVRTTAR